MKEKKKKTFDLVSSNEEVNSVLNDMKSNSKVYLKLITGLQLLGNFEGKTEIDFWGITERGESEFDGGESIYPRHIQLYFFVIKERMLKSSKFTQYFENIQNEITGFRSAILNYEFGFTKYFEKQGFKWDIYCRNDSYINSLYLRNQRWTTIQQVSFQ